MILDAISPMLTGLPIRVVMAMLPYLSCMLLQDVTKQEMPIVGLPLAASVQFVSYI